MLDPVKCFLEVNKDVVEILLMLKVSLADYSEVENLLCCAPSYSEAGLFFGNDLFCLWLQSVEDDL